MSALAVESGPGSGSGWDDIVRVWEDVNAPEGCKVGRFSVPRSDEFRAPDRVPVHVKNRDPRAEAHRPPRTPDVPGLCAALAEQLGARASPQDGDVVVDVTGLGHPTLAAVDTLARMQLTARRLGRRLTVQGAGPELRALLDLAGLAGGSSPQPSDGSSRSGRPNSGNQRCTSRNDVIPLTLPSAISITIRAHGLYPPWGSGW